MTKRMLVDATHAEEVRVAIVQDQRLIDLDTETASKEQIKGNIYLARITRVEPALQAAFVEFNNGRQGFLSVNDIHNKYYPPEDPEQESSPKTTKANSPANAPQESTPNVDNYEAGVKSGETPPEEGQTPASTEGYTDSDELPPTEELRTRPRRRHLPIQQLLVRGQSLLVQVAKEARGNKGASLTTNVSLAGRYTVLLPENSGGGGISRKITDPAERKHLKSILSTMEIPDQVSLIIRTAGLGRTKREIARDMSYLLRLWRMIKEKAKTSRSPAIIHEEGDLIIRTIRDLYTTDMEEILIDGQDGYRIGKDFMRLLMPRYVKVVQPYKDSLPLFARHKIENQIESMHERKVLLQAGGYLIIESTEALVTIDINSGRSTQEKDVAATAFKTNLQAAEEIGRQLRLRDLGGLIVIDFIDMDDRKHIQEVEKQFKESLKLDRAKIQIGKISQFGLLELSRQRMKPTFSETNRLECPHCKGLGTIRSVESTAVRIFRQLEEEAAKGHYSQLIYTTSQDVSNYLLNNKRSQIQNLEKSHATSIMIYGDTNLQTQEFQKGHIGRSQEELKEWENNRSGQQKVTEEPKEPEKIEDFSDPELADSDKKDSQKTGEKQDKRNKKEKKGKRERREKTGKSDVRGQDKTDNATESPHELDEPATGSLPSEDRVETGEKTRRRRRRRKKPGLAPTNTTQEVTLPSHHKSHPPGSPNAHQETSHQQFAGESTNAPSPPLALEDANPSETATQNTPATTTIPQSAASAIPTQQTTIQNVPPTKTGTDESTPNPKTPLPSGHDVDSHPANEHETTEQIATTLPQEKAETKDDIITHIPGLYTLSTEKESEQSSTHASQETTDPKKSGPVPMTVPEDYAADHGQEEAEPIAPAEGQAALRPKRKRRRRRPNQLRSSQEIIQLEEREDDTPSEGNKELAGSSTPTTKIATTTDTL